MINNFKSFEVVGATKVEAISSLKDVFSLTQEGNVSGDATAAYKKWEKENSPITTAKKKEFMVEYLTKKKAVPGVAYVITEKAAVKDTRERPWTIKDAERQEGKRKFTTFHVLKDAVTSEELARCETTKKEAKDLAKKVIANGFKGKGKCILQKFVTEGTEVEFTFEYTPSAGSHPGTYTVFGIAKD